jgi:hypothetical protein
LWERFSTAIYSVSRVGLDPVELIAGCAVHILQFCGSLFNLLNQLNQPNKPNKLNKPNEQKR